PPQNSAEARKLGGDQHSPLIKVSLYIYVLEELYRVSYKKLLRIIEKVLYCFLLQIILCYFNRHISKRDVCKG
ncbi:hypothetical protein, partial [Bacillus paranthracis]|uniref:hypothetical protein n=1 Tax=Bacillus paranthracis TaxID=2026186 RepID=UPI001C52E499